jgi:hypothetical protein
VTDFALSLCDIAGSPTLAERPQEVLRAVFDEALAASGAPSFARLYLGSYVCERFFLALDDAYFDAAAAFADAWGLGLTLVLPVFGPTTFEAGRVRTLELIGSGRFDEVVANDPATAEALAATPHQPTAFRLVRGRLLAKSARDPRYPAAFGGPCRYPLDARRASVERARWHWSLAEVDPAAPVVDASGLEDALPLALHLPHTLMSCGRVCAAASAGVPAERSFRPGMACAQQCLRGAELFRTGAEVTPDAYLVRLGRGVYFENPGCRVAGAPVERVVWTPADLLCGDAPEKGPSWA